jgi:hypothetical protein
VNDDFVVAVMTCLQMLDVGYLLNGAQQKRLQRTKVLISPACYIVDIDTVEHVTSAR